MVKPIDGRLSFTDLRHGAYNSTLARRLVPVADRLRDLLTKAGLRPYIMRLVWTQWSEGMRGYGVEEVLRTIDLLPTPKIRNIEELNELVRAEGVDEFGDIKVTQISARYTENFLRGLDENGNAIPDNQNFYYEIEFPDENGNFPGEKRRFTLGSAFALYPGRFGWEVRLTKAIGNRSNDGTPSSD